MLPQLDKPERGVLGSLAYPLRGAESMGVMGVVAVAIWMLGTALPEYLLSLMETAASTGHSLLGILVSLITSIPFLLLAPLVVFYWLSYLGRVIVSAEKGEMAPPRTPDRNFDGFLSALHPWLIWLLWGFGVGFAPAITVAAFSHPRTTTALWTAAVLGLIGGVYAMMALILAQIHGQISALSPFGVLAAIFRVPLPFIGRCLAILGLMVATVVMFVATVLLRDSVFWIYVPVRFAGCLAVAWASIVAMRILGIFAYHHRQALDGPR